MRNKTFLLLLAITVFFTCQDAFAKYNFFNGNDWTNIDSYKISQDDKREVKVMFIKAAIEPGFFKGTPLITYKQHGTYSDYVDVIDKFYKDDVNKEIPLFFTIKIADMIMSKASTTEVNNYRLVIMQKLKQAGL
jgi:hypothetical protein